MRRFILKLGILLLIVIVLFSAQVFCVFSFLMPQYTQAYSASLIDKVERLSGFDGPKIVLLGNSHLAFDVDSLQIEEAFSMPIVNMGFHGGMGNAFHERMARINVQAGDIYILAHTDYADNNQIEEADLAWSTLENHKEIWQLMRITDAPKLLSGFYDYVFRAVKLELNHQSNQSDINSVYNRLWFNAYGDNIYKRDETRFDFSQHPVQPPSINKTCINRINRLNRYLLDRGATLIVAGYPVGNGIYTEDAVEFKQFQIELENALECDVISDWADYMYNYDYFFDTYLHLNDRGKVLYTNQLIEDLRNWFESR